MKVLFFSETLPDSLACPPHCLPVVIVLPSDPDKAWPPEPLFAQLLNRDVQVVASHGGVCCVHCTHLHGDLVAWLTLWFLCVCLTCWMRSPWRDRPRTGLATEETSGTVCSGKDLQINQSLAESGTCHVPPSALSPVATSLHPWFPSQGAMDSPQSQSASISVPAASLTVSLHWPFIMF